MSAHTNRGKSKQALHPTWDGIRKLEITLLPFVIKRVSGFQQLIFSPIVLTVCSAACSDKGTVDISRLVCF